MSIENLKVVFDADTRGFNKGLKSVQSGISGMKSGITGLLKTGLGLAGLSAGVYGLVQSMQAYAGLRNSVQRTNELFQDGSKYITYFAENNARAFGMAETTAYQYAATYGNLFRGITKDATENAKVTIAVMKASGVIASKTGRTMEDVNERIRSGILGNTEAIEDLGINVPIAMIKTTKAFQDVAQGAKWENLTYQQQQQIRVLAILEQATNQYGNSVSQISGWSLPRLGQAFKDLVAYAGLFVTAGLQPVINALGRLVTWATAGLKALAKLFGLKVEGNLAPTTGAAAGAQKSLAGGANEAAKALGKQAKAAKKAKAATQGLAGFDELNILPSTPASADTGSGGSGGAGGGGGGLGGSPFDSLEMPEFKLPEIDTSKLEASFNKLKGLFDFTNLKNSWENLKKALQPISAKIGDGLKWLFDNVLVPFAAWVINDALPAFLNLLAGAFKVLNPLLDAVRPQFLWLWDNFLQPIASWTGGMIVSILNGLAGTLSKIGGWMSDNQGVVQGITAAVGAFFTAWKTTQLLSFIGESGGVIGALKRIKDALIGETAAKAASKWETIQLTAMYAKDFVVSLARSTAEIGKNVIAWGSQKAAMLASKAVDTAKWIGSGVTALVKSTLELGKNIIAWGAQKIAMGASAIAQGAMTLATGAWSVVCAIATGVTTAFGAAVAFLTSPIGLVVVAIVALIAIGVLLYKNWDTIKAKATEIWTSIKDFFKKTWENIKNDANKAWEGFKNFLSTNWEIIKSVASTVFTAIKNFFSATWNGIKTIFTTVIAAIVTFAKTWFNDFKNGVSVIFNAVKTFFSTVWNSIKTVFTTVISTIVNFVSSKFDSIKTTISNVFNSIKATATNIWNNIKNAITNPIETARNAVKTAIDKIKGFMNFNWSLPKLKMPSISISGGFSLMPPQVPKFSIKWNAKGALFTKPTIGGIDGNTLQGFGEAGPEAAIPLTDKVLSMIGKGIASTMDIESNGINNMFSKMDALMSKMQPTVAGDTYVQIGNDQLDAYIYRSNDRRNIRSNGR